MSQFLSPGCEEKVRATLIAGDYFGGLLFQRRNGSWSAFGWNQPACRLADYTTLRYSPEISSRHKLALTASASGAARSGRSREGNRFEKRHSDSTPVGPKPKLLDEPTTKLPPLSKINPTKTKPKTRSRVRASLGGVKGVGGITVYH